MVQCLKVDYLSLKISNSSGYYNMLKDEALTFSTISSDHSCVTSFIKCGSKLLRHYKKGEPLCCVTSLGKPGSKLLHPRTGLG